MIKVEALICDYAAPRIIVNIIFEDIRIIALDINLFINSY